MPKSATAETLILPLLWRYAVKKFDPSKHVDPADWAALEQAMVLSPSSTGLQPWRFVVVTTPELRKQLQTVSNGQLQIVDADKVVVLASKTAIDAAYVEKYMQRIAAVRSVPVESLAGFRGMILGNIEKKKASNQLDEWCARQTYIAAGVLVSSAAALGIDACPMEGIDGPKCDEILGLGEAGYATRMVVAVGYRHPDDPAGKMAKVRFEPSDIVFHR